MDPAFTHEETRFLLAEMIKASHVDPESLAFFIKSHGIEPDWNHWMSMQLPRGRNMNQCIQVAEHLSILSPAMKRKTISDQDERMTKRRALSDQPEHTASVGPSMVQYSPAASTTSSHVAILPRPANGYRVSPTTQPPVAAPRKRGRPSRADKARRDLRPNLPPQLAPKPPQGLTQSAPRSIFLAANSEISSRPETLQTTYSAVPGPAQGQGGKKRARRSPSDNSRPRIPAEGTFQNIAKEEHHLQRHEPLALEPELQSTTPSQSTLQRAPVTLPPLLRKDTATAPVISS